MGCGRRVCREHGLGIRRASLRHGMVERRSGDGRTPWLGVILVFLSWGYWALGPVDWLFVSAPFHLFAGWVTGSRRGEPVLCSESARHRGRAGQGHRPSCCRRARRCRHHLGHRQHHLSAFSDLGTGRRGAGRAESRGSSVRSGNDDCPDRPVDGNVGSSPRRQFSRPAVLATRPKYPRHRWSKTRICASTTLPGGQRTGRP